MTKIYAYPQRLEVNKTRMKVFLILGQSMCVCVCVCLSTPLVANEYGEVK